MELENKMIDKRFMIVDKKKLAQKLHYNREILRSQNRWVGGRVPLGYQAYRGLLLINKAEKRALERIFDLALKKFSAYFIWQIIKEEGYVNKKKKPISRNAIIRALEIERLDIYFGDKYGRPIAKKDERLYELLSQYKTRYELNK